MNFHQKLQRIWQQNNSLVCVGLDPDLEKLPRHLGTDNKAILAFNKALIDATADLVCAYKPQIAYYSAVGAEAELEQSISHIKNHYSHIPVILDAKRGDIGATAKQYAKEAFERYQADALTVNPYMGFDTLEPYFEYNNKGVIVLCHTSNPGAKQLQELRLSQSGLRLFEYVASEARKLFDQGAQISLVLGATLAEELKTVRAIVGDMPLLVPGLGAQGGDLQATIKNGLGKTNPALILNNSRALIYADSSVNFAQCCRQACTDMRDKIRESM